MFAAFRRSQPTGPLAEFVGTPAPARDTPLADAHLLAVDVETTGLKPGRDQLLSIGWVPVTAGVIELRGAQHFVVRSETPVGQSATLHGVTDDQVAAGTELGDVLSVFLQALRGRAMLAHFARIETEFLSHACQGEYGAPLRVPTVDTFAIERRHMERMGTYPRGEDLRLGRVRQRYGLPAYRSHHALGDAIACAELYLALVAQSSARRLGDVLS